MSSQEGISLRFKQEGPLTEQDFTILAISTSSYADESDSTVQWYRRFAEKRGIKKGDYLRYEIGRITARSQVGEAVVGELNE